MTLKTLNDFQEIREEVLMEKSQWYINLDKLRQEAINWVKEDRELLSVCDNEGEKAVVISLTKSLLERFNLTEEDLA